MTIELISCVTSNNDVIVMRSQVVGENKLIHKQIHFVRIVFLTINYTVQSRNVCK